MGRSLCKPNQHFFPFPFFPPRVAHCSIALPAYLSNQFPTTLLDLSPPTWMPSLRHLSWPLKIEWLVQRTSPSLVRRTLPADGAPPTIVSHRHLGSLLRTHASAGEGDGERNSCVWQAAERANTLDGNLTCEAGIGILVHARV